MRPRVFPAEDNCSQGITSAVVRASMRPRVFPAEDAEQDVKKYWDAIASMRPRVFPAEDLSNVEAVVGAGELQ